MKKIILTTLAISSLAFVSTSFADQSNLDINNQNCMGVIAGKIFTMKSKNHFNVTLYGSDPAYVSLSAENITLQNVYSEPYYKKKFFTITTGAATSNLPQITSCSITSYPGNPDRMLVKYIVRGADLYYQTTNGSSYSYGHLEEGSVLFDPVERKIVSFGMPAEIGNPTKVYQIGTGLDINNQNCMRVIAGKLFTMKSKNHLNITLYGSVPAYVLLSAENITLQTVHSEPYYKKEFFTITTGGSTSNLPQITSCSIISYLDRMLIKYIVRGADLYYQTTNSSSYSYGHLEEGGVLFDPVENKIVSFGMPAEMGSPTKVYQVGAGEIPFT